MLCGVESAAQRGFWRRFCRSSVRGGRISAGGEVWGGSPHSRDSVRREDSSKLRSDHPSSSTLTGDTVVFSLQAQSDLPVCGEKEEGGDRVHMPFCPGVGARVI